LIAFSCLISIGLISDSNHFSIDKDMAEEHGSDYKPLINAPKSQRYKQVRT
jgi:L-methionine (R)-S-oxide reductase